MRRWLIRLLIVVGSLFGLMLASGLVLKMLVSGSAKDTLAASLSEKLGAQVTVASAGFDLMQWFSLRPAVTLESVVIANPAGFGPRPLIEDDSFRSDETILLNAQVGYQINRIWTVTAEILNLLDRRDHDIDYAYESRVRPGDAPQTQIHFHPVEPIQARFAITARF